MIKPIIFTTFIICLFSANSHAQNDFQQKFDTTSNHIDIPDFSDLEKSDAPNPEIGEFQLPNPNNELNFSESTPQEPFVYKYGSPTTTDRNNIDNMPVIKPGFKSNMPVAEPDTSINYTLQIKKIPSAKDLFFSSPGDE